MKCLICYKTLDNYEIDYHGKCLKKLFGGFVLSPSYDLISTFLVITNETEQTSLTINENKIE
ncbi:MAG: hypothetical protein KKF62_08055 [Bacteroidetes bacterium]|nr:hypothetical protein [Bacteroidota bacterium]MBU1117085.1 hypothetical protein [Bacteroidota bacterium]MBU1798118.1 hypothetical protein [Bacteroidota bacterium]